MQVKGADRASVLEKRRQLKMAQSAHAYVRGNTLQFYDWLGSVKTGSLPDGPPVWICGDCHVGNLGPVADAKGRVKIQIRDLDQTVIGNPVHDLIRLALSLATAARGSDLPGVTTAKMLEEMMEGYEQALSNKSTRNGDSDNLPKPVKSVIRQALKRKWRHLAEERIEDVRPAIPLGRRFWAISKKEKREIASLFKTEEARKLVTCLHHRNSDDDVQVLDAAYWMKGCSSLGRLRYAVLIQIGKGDHKDGGLCLMDIKEAVQAAAPRAEIPMPRNNAQRVVEGARQLSPFLGERMLPAKFFDRSVVLRELLPQDLKLEMDQLTCNEATAAARYLSEVVGKAHARQMDGETRKKWSAELGRNRLKTVDAPSWLWKSVVELVASHELAYLEHCRRYAMESIESR